MRTTRVNGWRTLLACIVVCSAALAAHAQEKHRPAAGREGGPKYEAIVKKGGLETEQEYDLTEPEHLQQLTEALRNREVKSLRLQEPRNILAISWDLGLWTVVVFVLLLLVLRKLAWKPWLEATQRREQNIRAALEEAQRARDEANRIRQELQAEMNQAAAKVRDMLDEARRDAQRATEEMMAKARAEIQTERERLHHEIGMARDQALQELWTQTAQLATLISAKAIRRELNVEDHRRLVDEAIKDLGNAGDKRQREVVGVSS